MIIVHFCVESFDPTLGGMQESALRVMQLLADETEVRIIAYVIRAIGNAECPKEILKVVNIGARVNTLIAPLGERGSTHKAKEKARLEVFLVRNAIRHAVDERPKDKHVILSFFLSTAGFVAQHAATELCIPHVACSRGSDLGCNIFTQTGIATIEFVIKRAFKIITTNQEHRRFVQHICDRSDGVQVIYNSLPNHIRPIWRRRDSNRVRLVSAVGYSVKKGTAILLESVSHLIDEGLPVNLDVFGPTEPGCWGTLQQSYSARYGERMILQNMIDRKDIESLLVSKDIYCSASLSEGCSNATMLALGLGMPVVSTATGALVDLASGCQHVAITTVASVDEFTDALRRFARRTLEGTLCVNTTRLDTIVDRLSHKRERAEWLSVIGAAAGEYVLPSSQ